MTMTHFYRERHKTEEGRQTTLKFLQLEDECDKHNSTMLQVIDIKGISKTNINRAKSSFNIKHRDRLALRKRIATAPLSTFGRDRTWIKSL
jgi:hypothetical protein